MRSEDQDPAEASLKLSWEARNLIYARLFGEHAYSLPKLYQAPVIDLPGLKRASELMNVFGQSISPQRISVLVYPPSQQRDYWLYVSSGLSNPWFGEGDGEVAGFGCELLVKTSKEARWPIRLLRRLAYYILSYSGTLSPGVSLDMERPLFKEGESLLQSVLCWYADEAEDCVYQLPAGAFGIFSVIGLTAAESGLLRQIGEYGCWCLQELLRKRGYGQLTNPERPCLTSEENLNQQMESLLSYVGLFSKSEADK